MMNLDLELKIKTEFTILKRIIGLYHEMTDDNKANVLTKMIAIGKQLPTTLDSEAYTEWMIDQAYNNNLPKSSSGSWYSALTDIDNIICGISNITDQHTTEDEDLAINLCEKLHKEMIREIGLIYFGQS